MEQRRENKRTGFYGRLFFSLASFGVGAVGCSHSEIQPPYDSVAVDRSDPQHTVITLNGACSAGAAKEKSATEAMKSNSVTRDGKTYYFSSEADRDRFLETYTANSRY